MGAGRGGFPVADLELRLTQPAAGHRWLSGERLNPHPGVCPCLKDPSSPRQPPWRRGESSSAAPGRQPGRGVPDSQHFLPIWSRSVLTVRMLSRLLSHSLPLSLSLSPSPTSLSLSLFPPCLILCCSFQWRKIIILLNGFARGARTHARAHTHGRGTQSMHKSSGSL